MFLIKNDCYNKQVLIDVIVVCQYLVLPTAPSTTHNISFVYSTFTKVSKLLESFTDSKAVYVLRNLNFSWWNTFHCSLSNRVYITTRITNMRRKMWEAVIANHTLHVLKRVRYLYILSILDPIKLTTNFCFRCFYLLISWPIYVESGSGLSKALKCFCYKANKKAWLPLYTWVQSNRDFLILCNLYMLHSALIWN